MAKPRIPKAKAKATGADVAHKERFADRGEPVVTDPLGDAPIWFTDTEKNKPVEAWNTIRSEIPWLNSSHRILVTISATILGRLIAGQDVGVQALNLLRQSLGQMGATPADASKVGAQPSGEGSKDNPEAEFFGG